jgi:hypothetical protein
MGVATVNPLARYERACKICLGVVQLCFFFFFCLFCVVLFPSLPLCGIKDTCLCVKNWMCCLNSAALCSRSFGFCLSHVREINMG